MSNYERVQLRPLLKFKVAMTIMVHNNIKGNKDLIRYLFFKSKDYIVE